jgi:hypothetical protein
VAVFEFLFGIVAMLLAHAAVVRADEFHADAFAKR